MPKKITYERIQEVGDKHKLTNKQKLLVTEYIKNPKRKAKDINLAAGYSNYAALHGQVHLKKPQVRAAINELLSTHEYDIKIKGHYDDVLDLQPDDPLLKEKVKLADVKQRAVNALHKVRGDNAPVKSQSAKVIFKVDRGE